MPSSPRRIRPAHEAPTLGGTKETQGHIAKSLFELLFQSSIRDLNWCAKHRTATPKPCRFENAGHRSLRSLRYRGGGGLCGVARLQAAGPCSWRWRRVSKAGCHRELKGGFRNGVLNKCSGEGTGERNSKPGQVHCRGLEKERMNEWPGKESTMVAKSDGASMR